MTEAIRARRAPLAIVIALAVVGAYMLGSRGVDAASNLPSNKATVSASNLSVQGEGVTTEPILHAVMHTSDPADLLLQLTAECTILSSILNTGSTTKSYSSTVKLFITVDGKTVPAVPNATGSGANSGQGGVDDGKVVFCNRTFTRTTKFDDNSESIKDVEGTEQANGFNWVALNVGHGDHNIDVWAEFENTNTADATAHGVVDKRTLTIETTNYFISQPNA